MTLQLSASNSQFWCKPVDKVDLVDVKSIYLSKSSKPFQVPGLQLEHSNSAQVWILKTKGG